MNMRSPHTEAALAASTSLGAPDSEIGAARSGYRSAKIIDNPIHGAKCVPSVRDVWRIWRPYGCHLRTPQTRERCQVKVLSAAPIGN